jgi:hypothetical protein
MPGQIQYILQRRENHQSFSAPHGVHTRATRVRVKGTVSQERCLSCGIMNLVEESAEPTGVHDFLADLGKYVLVCIGDYSMHCSRLVNK